MHARFSAREVGFLAEKLFQRMKFRCTPCAVVRALISFVD